MTEWEKDRIKRAIQSCKNKIKHHYEKTHNNVSNAIKNEYVKIEALEKQILKKPIHKNNSCFKYECSSCGVCTITPYHEYCHRCGQALDWSDIK